MGDVCACTCVHGCERVRMHVCECVHAQASPSSVQESPEDTAVSLAWGAVECWAWCPGKRKAAESLCRPQQES